MFTVIRTKLKNLWKHNIVFFVSLILLLLGLSVELIEHYHKLETMQEHQNASKDIQIIIGLFFFLCCCHHFLIFRSIHKLDNLQTDSQEEKFLKYDSQWVGTDIERFIRMFIVFIMFTVSGELPYIYDKFNSIFGINNLETSFYKTSFFLSIMLLVWDIIGIKIDWIHVKGFFRFNWQRGEQDRSISRIIYPTARYLISDILSVLLWGFITWWFSYNQFTGVIWVAILLLLPYFLIVFYRFHGVINGIE